jgi:hypothetical protein
MELIGGHIRAWAWIFPEEKKWSVAQLEPLGDRLIARQVRLVEIIQQAAALADHDQEAAPGAMVLDIFLQMFGQMIDALGQKSDLHVRGPCVALVQPEPCYRLSFFHILFDQFLVNEHIRFEPDSCKVLFSRLLRRLIKGQLR